MNEKRFTMKGSTILENGEEMTAWDCCDLLNEQQSKITELEIELTDCKNRKEQSEYNLQKRIDEQEKIIKEQTLRTYCKDKEIQRLMGQLEKIPQSIREVWIDEQETE